MGILNLIKRLFIINKNIDVKILPSQGLFYRNDFKIKINRSSKSSILEYESDFKKDDLGSILSKVKKIVSDNTIVSDGYSFDHIKSIDIVFLFLEIVKFTKGKAINIEYNNEGKSAFIEFCSENFNYFKIGKDLSDMWSDKDKSFIIDGYKFSLPSIGIERCLTDFLIDKSYNPDSNNYTEYNYDFTYFLGDKDSLTIDEILNLIQIFNYDIDQSELDKIGVIIELLQPMQRYSLLKDEKVIEISAKLNLEKIFK